MKSYFSRLLHHILSHSDVKPQSTDISSYSGLTRISRWKKFANLFDLDTPIKSECDILEKSASTGRSMVEMLGVLAIIGVLSVGAIAGYSKAMMKYKLNKQAEQINSILNSTLSFEENLGRASGSGYQRISLIPILKKLNAIPLEMLIKNNDEQLKDATGSNIIIYSVKESSGQAYYQLTLGGNSFDVCMNVVNTFKANSNDLGQINISCWQGGQTTQVKRYFGDKYCSNSGKKCIRNMNVTQINDFCLTCKDEPQFIFGAIWNIHN